MGEVIDIDTCPVCKGSGCDEPAGWPAANVPALPAEITLAPEFGDTETLRNSRDWLRNALYAAGAKYGGGSGMGCGQADIDIEIEGHRFNVSIRPLPPRTTG